MRLNQMMGKSLTRVFVVAFVVAVAGVWFVQRDLVRGKAEQVLSVNRQKLCDALVASGDEELLRKARVATSMLPPTELLTEAGMFRICRRLGFDELHVIDTNGIIVRSTVPEFIGYEMAAHAQSRSFCVLLQGTREFAQDFGPIGYDSRRFRKYVGIALDRGGFLEIGFDAERFVPTPSLDSLLVMPTVMTAGLLLVLFVVVFLLVYRFFQRRIVAPIRSANTSLSMIASGNLDEKVLAGGSTEMDALADDINTTVNRLKDYIAEAEHRADAELAMAKSIQANVLPSVFPPYPNLVDRMDIYALMRTAKEVGGDFYDFYFVGSGKIALVIADVSGKGVPAALFMMRAKATIQGLLKGGIPLAEAVTAANDRLSEANDANMFVTAWVGIVDIETGLVEFVNAGHNPPLVQRADGSVAYLTGKSGPALAAVGGVFYGKTTLTLQPGDGLVLYTDGVTEAVDVNKGFYGEERLLASVRGMSKTTEAKHLLSGIVDDVFNFAAGAEQADDITLLAFRRKSPQ